MILRRVIAHFRKQEWTAIALDFLIVVIGVFVGIQVANWNEARAEREAEERYLVRLFADTQANIAELEGVIALHHQRASILADLEHALLQGGEAPSNEQLRGTLCRFFVQPGTALQQATYDELVASGSLSILRDEKLRILLSRQQAAVAEASRLNMVTPAVQHAAAPLEDYRQWSILREPGDLNPYGGVTCEFDLDGMRADPRMTSVIAQLYRDQDITARFRQAILEITLDMDERLQVLIDEKQIEVAESATP